MKEGKEELWPQGRNSREMQVVWFRQLQQVLKDFRRWTDSFLINEGALTLDPLNTLRLEGYSALSFDWKHEPVTYKLLVAFLLIASWGKGKDGWRRGKKRWVAKNASSWTWEFKAFTGQAFGERLKAYKVSDAFPGLIFLSLLFTNILRRKLLCTFNPPLLSYFLIVLPNYLFCPHGT